MSVRLKLKISVTTEPIGFFSSRYIPIGPVGVYAIFLGGGTPPTFLPKKKMFSGETTSHKIGSIRKKKNL